MKHIDRLRFGILEKRESRLRLWTSKWIPLCSIAVAVIALLTSTYLQRQASADQRILKEYELAFRPKIDGYTRLMQALTTSFQRSNNPGDPGLNTAFNEIVLTEIQLEPFLKAPVRNKVKDEVQEFIRFCLDVRRPNPSVPPESEKQTQEFLDRRNNLRNTLYPALFQ